MLKDERFYRCTGRQHEQKTRTSYYLHVLNVSKPPQVQIRKGKGKIQARVLFGGSCVANYQTVIHEASDVMTP
jgi:hypothetical protein